MNKPISIALVVVGVILLVLGAQASGSFTSNVSEAFTGAPSDKTIWLIVGGALCSILGVVGLIRSGQD